VKLGFVSAILPDLSLEEVAAVAKATGHDCVELMCWPRGKAERRYAGVTHVDVANLAKSQADEINGLFASAGVSISGLGYYPNPLSANEEESRIAIDHIMRVVEAAALLGVPVVNTFIGRDPKRSVDENWPHFREVWPPLIRFAEDHAIKIGIENCPMLFTSDEWPGGKNLAYSPAIWRRMFDEIPSANFGLNYDPSHLIWLKIDESEPLREFASRLVHVHAKDVRVDQSRLNEVGILGTPLQFHTPKLPGLGDVNWGRFFSILTDVGYDGPVCVEVEDRAYEGTLESRKASIRQSGTYLRQFIPKEG
jgi:sugar phosphate isomerase/epimerase